MNPTMTSNFFSGTKSLENNGLSSVLPHGKGVLSADSTSQFTSLWQQYAANGGNNSPLGFAALQKFDPQLTQRLSELLEISEEELLNLPEGLSEALLQQIKNTLTQTITGNHFTNAHGFNQDDLIEMDSLMHFLNPMSHSEKISLLDKRQAIDNFLLNQSQNTQLTNSLVLDMQSLKQKLDSVELSDKDLFKELGLDFKALLSKSDKFDQSLLSLRELHAGKVMDNLSGIERLSPQQSGLLSLTNNQLSSRSDNTLFSMPKIQVPLQQANWGQVVGERLMLMVNDKIKVANIMINPPELGPIEVRLNMQNDQPSVHFVSSHSAVRDAIEEALPRLREMFSQNGMSLADANVSQHSQQQQTNQQQSLTNSNTGSESELELDSISNDNDRQNYQAIDTGLVDQYV